jgi:hypothetical protein
MSGLRAARLYDEIAAELHRAATHAWATQGRHVREAQARLDAQSPEHARHSEP